MMWRIPDNLPAPEEVQRRALMCGVGLYPLFSAAAFEYGNASRFRDRSIILGYAALNEDEIRARDPSRRRRVEKSQDVCASPSTCHIRRRVEGPVKLKTSKPVSKARPPRPNNTKR